MKIFLTLFLLLGFTYVAGAQSFFDWKLHDRYFSIYGGTGWTGYVGDLTHGQPFSPGLSHFNLGVEARLYSKIGIRLQYAAYTLQGSDENAPDSTRLRQRNLSFYSTNHEWLLQGVYYFFRYNRKYHRRRTYEPYAAAGVGQTYFSPKANYTDSQGHTQAYDLRAVGTEPESYAGSAWVVPVSLGVKAALNEFLNLSLDLSYRFAFTGHLDDVYGQYGSFEQGSIAEALSNRKAEIPIVNAEAYNMLAPGSARGNGKNDAYFLINVSLELYLPQDLFAFGKKRPKRKHMNLWGKPSYKGK